MQEVGQGLGRVLAVPVEHDHDVEAMLDGQPVTDFLVPPVAEVLGLADQGDGQIGDLLVAKPDEVRRVLAVIVAHDHFVDVRPDRVGDTVEDLGQGGGGVVGHHQDPDALRLASYRLA